MTLRLRIVSEQRRLLGERGVFLLATAEATIGRSADNDWVLPDPQRYLSARHARIRYRGGAYVLEDLSTNGSYVNDSPDPLGKNAHPLQNGDLIRLGEYHIAVALEAEARAVKEDSGDLSSGVPTSINALHAVGRVSQTDIGAPLNLNELLVVEEPILSSAPRPIPGAQSILGDEPTDSAIQRRIARLAKAVQRQPRTGAAGSSSATELQSGLQAFCRGAGIAAERLPAEAHMRLMHLAGLLLRETFVGLRDLDRSQDEIRNRFRISLPVDHDDPRPSLSRSTVEELLLALLNGHELRSIDAVQWLRETLSATKDHESAVARAMRTAFVEFLDRLDPAELEARFERAARRRSAKAADRAQYWDLYTEFYRSLIEMPADHLPHTFVEAFARAYQELLRKDLPERAQASEG